MKLARIRAIARKESLHILRDPRSLAMAVAIPMLLILLFGYALTLDVDNVPVAVWDQSRSAESRELVSGFEGSRYFSLRRFARSYSELERAIDTGEVSVALVIPRDFTEQIATGRAAPVQVLVDGSDSNTATIVIGYVEAVAASYSTEVAIREARRSQPARLRPPLDLRQRFWFNADLESKNYIVPGLIAVIMMVIASLLTSLTIAREWEQGTMEQLISTPIEGRELILGKLIPYFALGFFDVVIAVLMGELLFDVPLRGSAALLFTMAAVFLAGSLALGMLISIVARGQLVASQLAMVLTFLPSFLLSGFMYAIANMPPAIQAISHLVPARYFVTLLKGIYLKGVGLEVLLLEAVLLAVFGVGVVALANFRFKKRLS